MLNDIRIKKGAIIDFNVNVDGEPNPKNQWFINGTSLTTSNRTKIDNSIENNTKLKTREAERIDSGTYKLIATNEHGNDEAEVNVVVLGIISIKFYLKINFRCTGITKRTVRTSKRNQR